MNPYLETLKEELREECGDTICEADWDEFYDVVMGIDDMAWLHAYNFGRDDADPDAESKHIATIAQGTRADMPSIVKYAYAAIEENLK